MPDTAWLLMYRNYYGLQSKPFSLTPDPAYYFTGEQYESALAILEFAVIHQEGIVTLTGEAGCGKTILIHHFAERVNPICTVGIISNPLMLKDNPLQAILLAFNLSISGRNDAVHHKELMSFLQEQHRAHRSTLLIVDEAQSLAYDTLENLRILTCQRIHNSANLQLVLVGQPPLVQTLALPQLEALSQFIVAHHHLEHLDQQGTIDYIEHRLRKARCKQRLFSHTAMLRIHSGSRGIPRLINVLCDMALMYGYTEGCKLIDTNIVNQVIKDRGITGRTSSSIQRSDISNRFLDRDNGMLLFSRKPRALQTGQA